MRVVVIKQHGSVLATLREEARLRQSDLAALVGCSQGWLSRAETNPRRVSITLLKRIAAVLTDQLDRPITVDDLLGDMDFCPTCRTPLAQTA